MKIPTIFLPEQRSLERNIEDILKKEMDARPDPVAVKALLKSCEELSKVRLELNNSNPEVPEMYERYNQLAEKIDYSKKDLERFCRILYLEKNSGDVFLGLYISALVNKIIKEEDDIILEPAFKLSGLGAFLPRGSLRIIGNTLAYTGAYMAGGALVLVGDSGSFTGMKKKGGDITVTHDAGSFAASYMEGGTFKAKKLESFSVYCMENGKVVADEIEDNNIGWMMRGGELHASKIIGRVHKTCEGKVYLNDKQVF